MNTPDKEAARAADDAALAAAEAWLFTLLTEESALSADRIIDSLIAVARRLQGENRQLSWSSPSGARYGVLWHRRRSRDSRRPSARQKGFTDMRDTCMNEWENRVFLGTCETMRELPDASVHLVVTSPPYDDIRTYGGNSGFDCLTVARELYRVLADGGIVSWVVQDATANFAKSDTSFDQVFRFKEAGFRRFETIIYQRLGRPGNWWRSRLRVDHEYIHVFLKGERPRSFTKPMVPAISAGRVFNSNSGRRTDGELIQGGSGAIQADEKCRGTIWNYGSASGDVDDLKVQHPATFPHALAADLIRTFSNEGDVVLDPFMGSGTTAIEAEVLSRRWVGYEIHPKYCELIARRTAQKGLNFGTRS
jgi:site-specific DNA-methyltransferase (adenine-specific)